MMKKVVVMSMVLSVAILSCNKESANQDMPCVPSSVSADVIAFYPFSGGSLNDHSEFGQHLTNPTTAAPATDREGNSNCAYGFDNLPESSEYLTKTTPTFLNSLDEFSISLWYKAEDTTRNGGLYELLIGRDVGFSCPDRNGQWSLGLYDLRKPVFGANNSVWDDRDYGSATTDEITIENTNSWHHLVATYEKTDFRMRLYRDGNLQESSTGNANCTAGTPFPINDIGDLFIGKDFTGIIDDIIVFNKKLNPGEVTDLFQMPACCE